MSEKEFTPQYSPWRHGGWYVTNIRYPSGACGCVSNNYPDKKWRIACDDRRKSGLGEQGDYTFKSRDAAAKAEFELVNAMVNIIEADAIKNSSNDVSDSHDKSYKDAEKIASEKGKLTVFDTSKNQSHQGKLIGVTDHHAVISLGRSAFIIERGPINIGDLGQNLKITFNGPKTSIATIREAKDTGIGGR